MNKYELTVVVNAMTEDDVRTAVIEKVKELVAKCGGTITAVDEAGKKKLAYEIQKMNEAFYYFFSIDAVAEFPNAIASELRIMDNVLRFLWVARYTLAVDRRRRSDGGEQTADFISCVAFDRAAEFAEKYLHQGTKIAVTGRIQTGSYTNRDGQKVYTTDVVIEEQEFAESKNSAGEGGYSQAAGRPEPSAAGDGFMNIPDGVEDEGLPF